MWLNTNGQIGINRSSPLSTLDVNAEVRVQSNVTAGDTPLLWLETRVF